MSLVCSHYYLSPPRGGAGFDDPLGEKSPGFLINELSVRCTVLPRFGSDGPAIRREVCEKRRRRSRERRQTTHAERGFPSPKLDSQTAVLPHEILPQDEVTTQGWQDRHFDSMICVAMEGQIDHTVATCLGRQSSGSHRHSARLR